MQLDKNEDIAFSSGKLRAKYVNTSTNSYENFQWNMKTWNSTCFREFWVNMGDGIQKVETQSYFHSWHLNLIGSLQLSIAHGPSAHWWTLEVKTSAVKPVFEVGRAWRPQVRLGGCTPDPLNGEREQTG